jgi:HEPN domain-containing protein
MAYATTQRHLVVTFAVLRLLRLFNHIPWGHSCFDLLEQALDLLDDDVVSTNSLIEATQRLDAHYIPTRYPDAFPNGVPADHYDEETAKQALNDAQTLLTFIKNQQSWH